MNVPVLADNAIIDDLDEEPEGFWDPVHVQVDSWLSKYGETSDNTD